MAASIELLPAVADLKINPGDVPTWHTWRAADDTVKFAAYYPDGGENIMVYAATYILVEGEIDDEGNQR